MFECNEEESWLNFEFIIVMYDTGIMRIYHISKLSTTQTKSTLNTGFSYLLNGNDKYVLCIYDINLSYNFLQ